MKEERNQTFCNAIANSNVLHIDDKYHNKGIVRPTSTKELLVKDLEGKESVQTSKARAGMHFWLGLIAGRFDIAQGLLKAMELLKKGSYLLIRKQAPCRQCSTTSN